MPGGAMLFDFGIVYNGRKLHTTGEVCCLRLPCFIWY